MNNEEKRRKGANQINFVDLWGGQQHNPFNHQHQSQSNNQFNQRHLIDWVWFVNWFVDWVDWVVVAGPYFHSKISLIWFHSHSIKINFIFSFQNKFTFFLFFAVGGWNGKKRWVMAAGPTKHSKEAKETIQLKKSLKSWGKRRMIEVSWATNI